MTIQYFKDDIVVDSPLNIKNNRIVEMTDFLEPQDSISFISYIESRSDSWGDIYFYGSSGMNILENDINITRFNLPLDFVTKLLEKSKSFVSEVFERDVVPVSFNIQKWDVGGFAIPHSDNSDLNGKVNAYEKNKYVSIIYLNDDYGGGELFFPEHNIEIKPKAQSIYTFPGGIENVHGVKEVQYGTRYTIVVFWDHSDSFYSDEKKAIWKKEIDMWMNIAQKQKEKYISDIQEETK